MRKLLLTTIVCAIVTIASAQTKTVSYYNEFGVKLATGLGAYYYEVTEADELGGGTKTRFLSATSAKVEFHTYSSLEGGENGNGILHGPFQEWHNNRKLSRQGSYEDNKLSGKLSTWFENGQLSYDKFYADGELQDTLKGYYEDGTIRRIETYNKGKMLEGKVFAKNGAKLKYFPAFTVARFRGGEQAMISYISRSLIYPKEATELGLDGLVLVTFVVETDGSIKKLDVIKSVADVLDTEAVWVIKSMPLWEPGLLEGKPVPVRFTLPIRFTIKG